MSNPPSDIDNLRNAAFSRNAAPADIEAWADAQAQLTAPDTMSSAETPASEADESPIALELASTLDDPDSPRRISPIATSLVAGLACAALGFSLGWAVLYPSRTSSLAVFDEPSTAEDAGSVLFDSVNESQAELRGGPSQIIGEQRLLLKNADLEVWVAIGAENFGSAEPNWETTVCMAVEIEAASANGNCVDLTEFNDQGISVPSPVPGDLRNYTWGPLGDLVIETRVAG